jgi:Fe-S cluster assembly protein SufD
MIEVMEDTSRHINGQRPQEGPAWIEALRRGAIERLETVGFPSRTDEEWRHTNIDPLVKTQFVLPGDTAEDDARGLHHQFSFGPDAVCELVFINGRYSPELSTVGQLPKGVRLGNLADEIAAESSQLQAVLAQHAKPDLNPFVALNTGFVSEGAFLFIPRGKTIEKAIHLLFISVAGGEKTVSHPRVLVIAEDNVEATIVESYVGREGTYFTNAVTEVVCGNDCRIDHCKLQQESLDAFHVATMQVLLGRSSNFVSHSASIGSRLTRNDLNVVMGGEFADATINGLVLANGNQHIDNHTLLDHQQPNCPSHELYKHVLNEKATAVFKGKILVRQVAQKTDSKQQSKALLLSDDATMNSQPALEIYADDVKCTHGSTTGPVDEEHVFYLQSRGVGLDAARHLLTYAFAADVTRRIRVEPVRRRLESYMANQAGLPTDIRITDLGSHDEQVRNM